MCCREKCDTKILGSNDILIMLYWWRLSFSKKVHQQRHFSTTGMEAAGGTEEEVLDQAKWRKKQLNWEKPAEEDVL